MHAPFNSAHEGYAVLLEEVDELWAEVKKRRSERDDERMGLEAIQVAAMAVRFLLDVVENPIQLGQDWVTRTTTSRAPELSVIGAGTPVWPENAVATKEPV
jgi:hypothetical protein